MLVEIKHPALSIALMFEDDGRTGYAYLVRASEGIVADVWVYNAADTPEEDEWKNSALAPFRNSKRYVKEARPFQLPSHKSDLDMNWSTMDDGCVGGVLFIRGTMVARLFEGDKPGKSLMASQDGPLARVLE